MLAVVPGQEEASHAKLKKVCDDFENSEKGLDLRKTCSEATKTSSSDFSSVATRSSPYKASWGEQFSALLWRSWLSIVKDPMILRIRIGTSIVSLRFYYLITFPSVHCIDLGSSLLWTRALWRGERQGGGDHEHQRRPLPLDHQHDLLQHVCSDQRFLPRTANFFAGAFQRDVSDGHLLHL